MLFANKSIGMKLSLGFCLVLIPLVLVAIVGLMGIGNMYSNLENVLMNANVKVALANEMGNDINVIARAVRNMVLSDDEKEDLAEKQRIDTARTQLKLAYAKLTRMVSTEQGKAILFKINEMDTQVNPLIDKVLELGLANKAAEATRILMTEVRIPQKKLIENIDALIAYQGEILKRTGETAEHVYDINRTLMISISLIALALGVLISFFLTRNIGRSLSQISTGIDEGAEQVTSASGQVASASQSLAEGASEQAATIEETASSLEEISSMVKQNSCNAAQADNLMKDANRIVARAEISMSQLTRSMTEITEASEETSKIIKTIDEIAFQTNLLALNAAVEAARAGEAGAGFAVVADEVRNLALRAADAAKSTARLIEGTVTKIREGAHIVSQTSTDFSEVAQHAAQVGELVAEITAASSEQAQGVEQVNKAVAEMDKVVQQNAASSEENASASEEMHGQAEQMRDYVRKLAVLVSGNGRKHPMPYLQSQKRTQIPVYPVMALENLSADTNPD
jgi:methyl-accepting chemotaxis protein